VDVEDARFLDLDQIRGGGGAGGVPGGFPGGGGGPRPLTPPRVPGT
jgi:hypothetical protein